MIKINEHCLKIDKINLVAMINGFVKEGKVIKTSMLSSSSDHHAYKCNFLKLPKLLRQTKKVNPNHPYSKVGASLYNTNYIHRNKYLAVLDSIFYLRQNDIEVWRIVCQNGLFDIWEPDAPYNNLISEKSNNQKKNPCILLVRVFELDNEIPELNIDRSNGDAYTKIKGVSSVNLKQPMIANDEFSNLKHKLETSISSFIKHSVPIRDTNRIL